MSTKSYDAYIVAFAAHSSGEVFTAVFWAVLYATYLKDVQQWCCAGARLQAPGGSLWPPRAVGRGPGSAWPHDVHGGSCDCPEERLSAALRGAVPAGPRPVPGGSYRQRTAAGSQHLSAHRAWQQWAGAWRCCGTCLAWCCRGRSCSRTCRHRPPWTLQQPSGQQRRQQQQCPADAGVCRGCQRLR